MTELILTISDPNDDGDEDATGAVTLNRTGFTVNVVDEWGAFRFTGVTIPQGATIDTANMDVYCLAASAPNDSPDGTLRIEDVDNAAALSTTNSSISTRTYATATVAWNDTNMTGGANAFVTTPDIAALIQEVVDRAGWASGNAMLIVFESNAAAEGIRFGYRDGNTSWSATLTINYTVAGGVVQKAHHIAEGVTHYSKFNRVHH